MPEPADQPADRPSWLPETPRSRARAAAEHLAGPAPDVIAAAYSWSGLGRCVSCARRRWTTALRTFVAPGSNRPQPLLMCAACVLDAEEERWRRCDERGLPYEPGRLGRPM